MKSPEKELRHAVPPAVARLFVQKFPGVELDFFNALRRDTHDGIPYTCDRHVLVFIGKTDELLRLRLIEPHMIPPKRKHKLYWVDLTSHEDVGAERWNTKRVAKGRLKVWRELTDNTPQNHPLADFGVWAWPIGETAKERRARYEKKLSDIMHFASLANHAFVTGLLDEFGLHDAHWPRALQCLTRFESELTAVLKGAAPRAADESLLRLVIDNTRADLANG